MIAIELAGWIGAVALLLAYGLVTNRTVTNSGRACAALNLAGSAGLSVNACAHSAWPSLALNVLWLAIAGRALGHELRRAPAPARTS